MHQPVTCKRPRRPGRPIPPPFVSLPGLQVYYVYGFFLLVFLILLIVTACVTVVGTYFLLNAENYHWQWASFGAGASTCESACTAFPPAVVGKARDSGARWRPPWCPCGRERFAARVASSAAPTLTECGRMLAMPDCCSWPSLPHAPGCAHLASPPCWACPNPNPCFLFSFPAALYVFMYSIHYFFVKTKMTGFFQTSFYFGYTLMFCVGECLFRS